MYKLSEIYRISKKENYYSMVLLIDYLIKERKVLNWDDTEDKLAYYLQDRFHKKMNEYLNEYEVERNGGS